MKPLIVSACLLGTACRYDGASKPADRIITLKDKYNLIPVCPEILGGLPTPRTPCEVKNGCVFSRDGFDRTAQYLKGADEVLRLARFFGCEAALLKERSPACGSGKIYDGSFSGGWLLFRARKLGEGRYGVISRGGGPLAYGLSLVPDSQLEDWNSLAASISTEETA